jgi:predicted Ser/Thr protein kinase
VSRTPTCADDVPELPELEALRAAPGAVLKDEGPRTARVRRCDLLGGPVVLKEWDPPRGRLIRAWARFFMRRELRHYRALEGIAGIPRLRRVYGNHAFVLEFVDGEPLERRLAQAHPERFARALDDLEQVLAALHARRFCHLDLHQKRNALVDAAGRVWLVDLGQGLDFSRGWLRQPLFGLAARIDRNAVLKFRARYAPQTLDPAVRDAVVARFGGRKRRWYFDAPRRLLRRLFIGRG